MNKNTSSNKVLNSKNISKLIDNSSDNKKPLLSVKDLSMIFKVRGAYKKVLDNISFDVEQGDFFGIIGESGSGKTTTGKVIIKLHQASGGVVEFDNELISQPRLSFNKKRWMHKNIQMIFQDPMSSMDPIKNILKIVSEPLVINRIVQKETIEFIKKINIIRKYFKYHFHEENFNNLLNFKLNYFKSLFDIYSKWTDKIINYNYDEVKDLFAASEIIDSIISDLLDDLQLNMEKTYILNKEQMDLIDLNIKKYEKGDLDPIDIELYKSSIKLKQVKNLKNNSAYSIELKNNKKELLSKIKEFKKGFFTKYLHDNKNYFNVLRSKLISSIKTFKQSKLLSRDNFLYAYYKLQEISYIESRNVLNLLIEKYKYLDVNEIDSLFNDVELYRVNKYNYVLTDLLNKKSEFDKVKINEKIQLIKSLEQINSFIDKSIKESNKKYILESSEIYSSLKRKYSPLSNAKISEYNSKENDYDKKLKDLSIAIDNEKANIRQNKNVTIQKWTKDYQSAKKHYNDVVNKRNKIINDWKVHQDAKNIENNKKLSQINVWKTNSEKAQLFFKNSVVSFLNHFSEKEIASCKTLSEKLAKKKYIKVIRKSLNPKWKSQKIIKYQYKSSLNSFLTVTKLHNLDVSILSWFGYFPILQLITRSKVYNALTSVGLKHEHAYRYPHEFSGGQRQRIVIARALITKPKLIIADEPISALDVSIQSQVINIMKDLAKQHGVTFLFIAHDLSMVSYACNKVIIMHNGKIVEKGDATSIFKNPIHPYTKTLFNAAPELSKIHVDLASFDEEMTYDKNYGPLNQPKFIQVNDKKDHQVLATNDQIKEWTHK